MGNVKHSYKAYNITYASVIPKSRALSFSWTSADSVVPAELNRKYTYAHLQFSMFIYLFIYLFLFSHFTARGPSYPYMYTFSVKNVMGNLIGIALNL